MSRLAALKARQAISGNFSKIQIFAIFSA